MWGVLFTKYIYTPNNSWPLHMQIFSPSKMSEITLGDSEISFPCRHILKPFSVLRTCRHLWWRHSKQTHTAHLMKRGPHLQYDLSTRNYAWLVALWEWLVLQEWLVLYKSLKYWFCWLKFMKCLMKKDKMVQWCKIHEKRWGNKTRGHTTRFFPCRSLLNSKYKLNGRQLNHEDESSKPQDFFKG